MIVIVNLNGYQSAAMITHNYNFSDDLIKKDLRRLINQIWKLLPMRENNEDWRRQLQSVLNELYGLHNMFGGQLDFLILLSKLEGLTQTEDYMAYRTVIFSVISLLTDMANKL